MESKIVLLYEEVVEVFEKVLILGDFGEYEVYVYNFCGIF